MYLPDGRIRKMRRSAEDPAAAHELTFSCYRRLPLLSRDRTRRWLLDALDAARHAQNFELWAYVIMPEHVHVLIAPRDADFLVRRALQGMKQPVARVAIDCLRRQNPEWLRHVSNEKTNRIHFWQPGGGFDRNVNYADTAWKMVEYIHGNPVKRGLVGTPEDWPWSSARWYAGAGEIHLEMDATPPWRD